VETALGLAFDWYTMDGSFDSAIISKQAPLSFFGPLGFFESENKALNANQLSETDKNGGKILGNHERARGRGRTMDNTNSDNDPRSAEQHGLAIHTRRVGLIRRCGRA
jgi:hypothetical protein